MAEFSHCDKEGNARMVDVGNKPKQWRYASAQGVIYLSKETQDKIQQHEITKGNVLTVAQIAGVQAAKCTPSLIPLCHTLVLDCVDVHFEFIDQGILVTSTVSCVERTGAEMEALTAVTIALLTIYDMCKAVDKKMRLGEIKLIEKVKKDAESR